MTETVGQQLQKARLERGLSIEAAATATRVRVYYLKALENDDIASLPSVVQGRGFLRLYADFLGIDPMPLLEGYGGKPAPAAPPPVPEAPAEPLPAAPNPGTPAVVLPEPIQEDELEPIPTPLHEPISKPATPEVEPTAQHPIQLSGEPLKSQQIFQEIGQALRKQRELLSLSLVDVEKHTRLRVHYLEVLEAGRMEEMPSMVQGRGMLVNYLRFLNMDVDACLLRFADALQARREELLAAQAPAPSHHRPAAKVPAHPTLKRFFSLDLFITSGLVVLLVVFLVWGASQVASLRPQSTSHATAPAVEEVLMSSPSGSGTGTPSANGTQVAAVQPTTSSDSAGEQPTIDPNLPTAQPGAVQVTIVAQQRVWMRVTVDEKVKFNGRTVPGSAYPFSGSKQIQVRVGNAGGIEILYNQNNLGTPGSIGQVADLMFDENGMVMPTQSATPTTNQTPSSTTTPSASGSATPAGTEATTPQPSNSTATPRH